VILRPLQTIIPGLPAVTPGVPAVIVGPPTVIAGVPAVIAGVPAVAAGLPAVIAGLPAAIAGSPGITARSSCEDLPGELEGAGAGRNGSLPLPVCGDSALHFRISRGGTSRGDGCCRTAIPPHPATATPAGVTQSYESLGGKGSTTAQPLTWPDARGRGMHEEGKESTRSFPLSDYRAPGGLPQGPGRAAGSPGSGETLRHS
jgi:hypothetical protein